MQDRPPAELLIEEVRKALQDGIALGFAQKVAANALGIAQREIVDSPATDASEHDRLAAIVGSAGALAERNRRLCEAIRSGCECNDQIIAHLICSTIAKIEVDQPGYPPFRALID